MIERTSFGREEALPDRRLRAAAVDLAHDRGQPPPRDRVARALVADHGPVAARPRRRAVSPLAESDRARPGDEDDGRGVESLSRGSGERDACVARQEDAPLAENVFERAEERPSVVNGVDAGEPDRDAVRIAMPAPAAASASAAAS